MQGGDRIGIERHGVGVFRGEEDAKKGLPKTDTTVEAEDALGAHLDSERNIRKDRMKFGTFGEQVASVEKPAEPEVSATETLIREIEKIKGEIIDLRGKKNPTDEDGAKIIKLVSEAQDKMMLLKKSVGESV